VAAAGGIAASGHRAIWSKGQGDFTVVYASATTLTLGAFPTALGTPDDGDFVMVVVTDSTGLQRAYLPTANAMTLTGQVLTVAGASFVTGGSADLDYDVFVWGPPKTYDPDANSDNSWRVNPEYTHVDSDQQSATALGDGTTYKYWDMETYRFWSTNIVDTAGASGSNLYTLWMSTQNDGTAQESCLYRDITLAHLGKASFSSAELAADPTLALWELNLPFNAKYLRIKSVRTGDGAATDGAYTYDAMWS
jgi:hypothetical protein